MKNERSPVSSESNSTSTASTTSAVGNEKTVQADLQDHLYVLKEKVLNLIERFGEIMESKTSAELLEPEEKIDPSYWFLLWHWKGAILVRIAQEIELGLELFA